jgi:hypothetical protein
MDANNSLLFVADCPSFCMGHRLRNSDTLSRSVEAAVTFPGDPAPEFCAAEALPVGACRTRLSFSHSNSLVIRWRSKRLHTWAFVFWLACCSLRRK